MSWEISRWDVEMENCDLRWFFGYMQRFLSHILQGGQCQVGSSLEMEVSEMKLMSNRRGTNLFDELKVSDRLNTRPDSSSALTKSSCNDPSIS